MTGHLVSAETISGDIAIFSKGTDAEASILKIIGYIWFISKTMIIPVVV